MKMIYLEEAAQVDVPLNWNRAKGFPDEFDNQPPPLVTWIMLQDH